jgi:hypothetical protein
MGRRRTHPKVAPDQVCHRSRPLDRQPARYDRPVTSLDDELERLFATDYLDAVDERALDDVRTMRAECQEAETVVSYLRRVVQGRLDVVHSFIDHHNTGQSVGDLDAVVEDLSSIIGSGPARPQGYGRLPSQMSPDMEKADLTREIDDVLDADGIGKLPTMTEGELRSLAERLTVIEQRISDERRTLHERIDALQAEIVSRYKTGDVNPDDLLS